MDRLFAQFKSSYAAASVVPPRVSHAVMKDKPVSVEETPTFVWQAIKDER